MSQRSSAAARRSAALPRLDAEEVLETLQALIPQVASPVVQECLRAARYEIAYLTSTEGEIKEEDDQDISEAAGAPAHSAKAQEAA